MAKKGRHRKGGRVTPKGTRPQGFRSRPRDEVDQVDMWDEPEPDLISDVRQALADDHPLGLLALVSSLLAVVDPRLISPFERTRDRPAGPSREELLGTFIEVDQPETSALLAAIAALGGDEVERHRIRRVLADRNHQLPRWLSGMSGAAAYRAVEMSHVLRDGDNVMVGVRFRTGDELTAVVYIDHNLGTAGEGRVRRPPGDRRAGRPDAGEGGRPRHDVRRHPDRGRQSTDRGRHRDGRDHVPAVRDRDLARVPTVGRVDDWACSRRWSQLRTTRVERRRSRGADRAVLLVAVRRAPRQPRSPGSARQHPLVRLRLRAR